MLYLPRSPFGRHAALLAALAALPLGGCMELDPTLEAPPKIETHVKDWREEIIYQVLVDRFANGDYSNDYGVDTSAPGKYHGGDWKGLEDHLDYVSDLGVTTLWISPVVKNVETDAGFDAYHGYWAQDLTEPNEHFGDLLALRSLIRSAHEKDIKVILDIVTNHMGQIFYYDINENGQPDENVSGSGTTSSVVHINEYDPDFDPRGVQASTSLGESGPAPVIFLNDPATNHMPPRPLVFQNPAAYNRKGRTFNFDDPDQLLHGDFPGGLKDVDTTRCDVKDAYVDSFATWVEQTDLDGFRIDTVKHVEREFWRYFTQKLRARLAKDGKKNFFMFGEAFDGRDQLVGSFTLDDVPAAVDLKRENECVKDGVAITGAQLDSVFYFPQYYTAIRDVFTTGLDTQRIQDLWALRATDWGQRAQAGGIGVAPADVPVNFLDNHDVPRFLFNGRPVQALHNAYTFLLTEQGVPCLYYGDEQEFKGGNDPANREDFWKSNYDESGDTFAWVHKLTTLRRKFSALQKGDQKVTWATTRTGGEMDAGILAFERSGGGAASGAYALVVINTNATHPSSPQFNGTPMKVSAPSGTTLVDVLGNAGNFTVQGDGGLLVTVPPTSAVILVPQGQTNGN